MIDFIFSAADSISDVLLMLSLPLAYLFVVNYGSLSPWYREPVGQATFLNSTSNALLLTLIVYGIVFGQAIGEGARAVVAAMVFLALLYKNGVLIWERRRGRSRRRVDRERPIPVEKENR